MPKGEHPNSRANLQYRRFRPIPPETQKRIVSTYEALGMDAIRRRFKLSVPRIRAVLVAHGVPIRPRGVNAT